MSCECSSTKQGAKITATKFFFHHPDPPLVHNFIINNLSKLLSTVFHRFICTFHSLFGNSPPNKTKFHLHQDKTWNHLLSNAPQSHKITKSTTPLNDKTISLLFAFASTISKIMVELLKCWFLSPISCFSSHLFYSKDLFESCFDSQNFCFHEWPCPQQDARKHDTQENYLSFVLLCVKSLWGTRQVPSFKRWIYPKYEINMRSF